MIVIEDTGRKLADVMRDHEITAKAKGVFAYLYALGEGEHVTLDMMVGDMQEQIAALRAAVKELENHGYLVRTADNSRGYRVYDWKLQL